MFMRAALLGVCACVAAPAVAETIIATQAVSVRDPGGGLYDVDYDFLQTGWSYSAGTDADCKNNSFKSWISFNTSTLQRQYIQTAQLTITQMSHGAEAIPSPVNIDLYALTDASLDGWNANTIAWATAPANVADSSKSLDPTKTLLVGTLTLSGSFPAAGTVLAVDLNAAGIDFLRNEENDTSTFIFAARDDAPFLNGLQAYRTGQSQFAPAMIVTVPEPTIIGGLLAVSVGLSLRKRSRRKGVAA